MKIRAYAKINLSLDVVSRNSDGYHELDMIMVPIDFYDTVDINISREMEYKSNVKFLPLDERNTMVKAVNKMREFYGFKENFSINLIKHIPTQAGLAGGSADAAAVVKGIIKLLNLSVDIDDIMKICKEIGADVPFCYINKPSRVQGIGEKITPFSMQADYHVFLVKPRKGVSTKLAFNMLDIDNLIHPDIPLIKTALVNNDYEMLCENIKNSLEQSALKIVPEIEVIKEYLLELGFDTALMSGSGSTVFALTKNNELIDKASALFKKRGYFVRKTAIKY